MTVWTHHLNGNGLHLNGRGTGALAHNFIQFIKKLDFKKSMFSNQMTELLRRVSDSKIKRSNTIERKKS